MKKILTRLGALAVTTLALGTGSAQAAGDNAATAAAALKQDAVCTRCHDESEAKSILAIYQTRHGVKGDARAPSCQSCHGASENHLKNKSVPPDVTFGRNKSDALVQDTACLACHKSDKRTHWDGGQHEANDVSCSSCHAVHAGADKVRERKTQPQVCFACHKDQRADSRKTSHHAIGEGKVVCSDCHNPHGSTAAKLLKKNTVNETCYACHAEKRGPFLWEHQPATEDCTACHTPHGSNVTPLLKSRAPFLCSECHDGPHHSKDPAGVSVGGLQSGGTAGTNGVSENYTGRACLNCHSMVHGSNHPAGALLHR